jgi:hypothetical protein
MGRVIRHRYDYGAILLADERFCSPGNQRQLSKWLKQYLQAYDGFGQAIASLTKFFKVGRGDWVTLWDQALGGCLVTYMVMRATAGCRDSCYHHATMHTTQPAVAYAIQNGGLNSQ